MYVIHKTAIFAGLDGVHRVKGIECRTIKYCATFDIVEYPYLEPHITILLL